MNVQKSLTFALAAALVATVACDDDDTTGPQDPALFGDLEATQAEFVSPDDPGLSSDVVADGGSFTLSVDESGFFESSFDRGDGPVNVTGTVTETADGRVTFSDSPFLNDAAITQREFTVTRENTGTLMASEDVRFDFDQDGVQDRAAVDVILTEQ